MGYDYFTTLKHIEIKIIGNKILSSLVHNKFGFINLIDVLDLIFSNCIWNKDNQIEEFFLKYAKLEIRLINTI